MYNMLISHLSCQSIPFPFRICINLAQFTWSNAFYQSMKQTHNSSSVSIVQSAIILSIPVVSPVPFPFINPNWSSPSTTSVFLIILCGGHATVFAVCAVRLTGQWSLHFVASGSFFQAVIVTSMKFLQHTLVSCMLLISCVIILRLSSTNSLSTCLGTPLSPLTLSLILTAFSPSLGKIQGPFPSASASSSVLTSSFLWLIR